MPTAHFVALVPVDIQRSALGLPSLAGRTLDGRPVLAHVVQRLLRVKAAQRIILVHPPDQNPIALLEGLETGGRVSAMGLGGETDPYRAWRASARKWALACWRGGLGGATCYDELLPAKPLLSAMKAAQADSVLLVGGDWPLVDPHLCQQAAQRHLEQPEAMALTFTQAPPGLSGIVFGRALLEQLDAHAGATFGQVLGYVPSRPQADPIGKDVCVQITAPVRSCRQRFIYDTTRSQTLIEALVQRLGSNWTQADTNRIVAAANELTSSGDSSCQIRPEAITLELTPRRIPQGPLIPQHYVALPRESMSLDLALKIVSDLAAINANDLLLTLGGLGDALLHPQWDRVAQAAHEAGFLGLALETDLLVEQETLAKIMASPLDVLSIRLNADRATTYEKVMGHDGLGKVIANLQWLHQQRDKKTQSIPSATLLPWLTPRLVKSADTLEDMEDFFDKWVHYLGHAVIEPATQGCGLMPALSPVRMAPPRRRPCRQLGRRLTILSDGRVALCDQDWLGKGAPGAWNDKPWDELWGQLQKLSFAHEAQRWDESPLCAVCEEWHRP